jgi:hypothetical protein
MNEVILYSESLVILYLVMACIWLTAKCRRLEKELNNRIRWQRKEIQRLRERI